MSFLRAFVPQSGHRHSAHKRATKSTAYTADLLRGYAYIFGISLFVLALAQLLITLLLNISPNANLFDVYSRNASSVVCLILIGIYLIQWFYFNGHSHKSNKRITRFRVITVIATTFCLVKGILSVYYTISLAYRGIYVILYYLGDVVAWFMIALYLFRYAMTKLSKRHKSSSKGYKALTIILAIACIAKAATALLYTIINYHPNVFPWVYYLCDTVAWTMLFIIFVTYASSPLVGMSIHKQHRRETIDQEMAQAMNKVGQCQSQGRFLD